ncbi:MAG TPA: lipid A biosynthesis acyltransferase, partial [Burkholderiaceae bacterium]|nr:lipid A biosynthesis acyltransferase [Burkholderiaceae bacterium]
MNAAIARFWISLIHRAARWSARSRQRIAAAVGTLAWLVVVRRRRIADANLRACFPQMTSRERHAMIRRLFRRMARGALDYGLLWNGSREEVQRFVRVEGLEHLLLENNRPLIMLAPH